MAFTFGWTSPTGTQMSVGVGDKPPIRAGEPKGLPTRTLFIAGGLAVAAVALVILLK